MTFRTRTVSTVFLAMAILVLGGSLWFASHAASPAEETVPTENFAQMIEQEFYIPQANADEEETPQATAILEQIYAPQCSIQKHRTAAGTVAMNSCR